MNSLDYRMENVNKRRKYEHPEDDIESMDRSGSGWQLLQPILENEIMCAKIPTSDMALDLLAKWFQVISADQDKLRVFRQWIMTSAAEDSPSKKVSPSPNQLVPTVIIDTKKDTDEPADDVPSTTPDSDTAPNSDSSKATSIEYINNEIPITPRSTPQVLLLQQLLQKQQQQIVLLQKLQNPSELIPSLVPTANTITLSSTSGSAGVVLTVNLKGTQWHSLSDTCTCTCGFTTPEGAVTTSQRIPGGSEGEMRFAVPPIAFPSQEVTQIQMAVHLTSCAAPHAPLVCPDSFMYARERASSAISSDEDSEDTPDSSVCDDEEIDEDSSEREAPTASPSSASPKQLMNVRERMLEYIHSATKGVGRVVVAQQPPSRVVWKNRRLDTPFKIRVEGISCDTPSTKLAVLALVVDHKGKLQIDAMENFDEECNPQGVALFHNLRMTKGTWGKEWSITFVVVLKGSIATNNPSVVGVSQACPVVVKTRKNPQVRHITRSESPSPVSFVERKPDTAIRMKRNRVEDLLDHPSVTGSPSAPASSSASRTGSHSEAMTNLLYAAEIKQQEREYRPPTSLPLSTSPVSSSPPSPPRTSLILPSMQSGFGSPDPNFANLQGLLGYLEEIKIKHHPSMTIIEQPQLKRDGKVLIVKKGKPFRTPFRLQMRTTPLLPQSRSSYSQVPDYNPQQYVCVAVLHNDKGEEVALKNSEVAFDARGLATFSGLMVMKGTWGKSVQLTFEARWSGARRIVGGSNWPPLRMLVVAETAAIQLMCYTKDKKAAGVV